MFLVGDIGGTKTLLELGALRGGEWFPYQRGRLPTRNFSSVEDILRHFLPPGVEVEAICLGVAGPVVDGRARFTHLPWTIEEEALSLAFGGARVKLLNDLEAAGWALIACPDLTLETLQEGEGKGNRAVIAAGTGLGEAQLLRLGERDHVLATEGGHCDFAPRTEEQVALLEWFWREGFRQVSFDEILSGRGLKRLYRFLLSREGKPMPPELEGSDDWAPEISRRALSGEDRCAEAALRLWCEIYGAEGGNLVLKSLALGGLLVAGGIAPKILPYLKRYFLRGFLNKGRFRDLLRKVPVWVVLDEDLVLKGAKTWLLRREVER